MVTPTQRLRERWQRRRDQRARDKAYIARVEDAFERGGPYEVRAVLNELTNPDEREAALVLAALCGLLGEEPGAK